MKLTRPIVLAPMAGGVTTPQLCAAVAKEGGLPFLAAGYLTDQELVSTIEKYESLTCLDYGINIFYPAEKQERKEDYSSYRKTLLAQDGYADEDLPEFPLYNDDFYQEKIDVVINSNAKYVSFTFGYPEDFIIKKIQAAGKKVVLCTTSKSGINYIEKSLADIIAIQGKNAGGHQATVVDIDDTENVSLEDLVKFALSISNKPIIAGGGVGSSGDVLRLIRLGATAVQVGTMFLLAKEAGTKQTHRDALLNFRDRDTVLTKAFTGKLARSIENEFIKKFDKVSIELYPQVHYLTKKIRKNAGLNNNPEGLHLWAGTGFTKTYSAGAKEIIRDLTASVVS